MPSIGLNLIYQRLALGLAAIALAAPAVAQSERAEERKTTLAKAKVIYIDSQTRFVKQAELEKALLKHKEFDEWGLELTREKFAADVIVEVKRASFQNNFPYSVVDRRTKVVLAAGEVNSVGGTAYGKIASQLIGKIKKAREK